MSQRIYEPPPELQQEVKYFWTLDAADEVYTHNSIFPDSYKELVILGGAPVFRETEAGKWVELPRIYLNSLQTQPHRFRVSGRAQVIAVRLYPWAVPALTELGDTQEPGVLAPSWQYLARRVALLFEHQEEEEAIATLERFVSERYRNLSGDAATMREVGQLIYTKRGRLDTQDAAARGFFSLSQLERLFKNLTGVTPKTYARLVRFESICDALAENPARSLTELAHEFRYTDQSHFIRDFKLLAGRTPGSMAAYARAYLERYQAADFIQFN